MAPPLQRGSALGCCAHRQMGHLRTAVCLKCPEKARKGRPAALTPPSAGIPTMIVHDCATLVRPRNKRPPEKKKHRPRSLPRGPHADRVRSLLSLAATVAFKYYRVSLLSPLQLHLFLDSLPSPGRRTDSGPSIISPREIQQFRDLSSCPTLSAADAAWCAGASGS